jgi:hypothetical protein
MYLLLGDSITYRIAVGPLQGRKAFTLQTLPACEPYDSITDTEGKVADFSLHAGVAAKAHERKKTGTAVSIHQPSGGIGKPPVANVRRECALRAENALKQKGQARLKARFLIPIKHSFPRFNLDDSIGYFNRV